MTLRLLSILTILFAAAPAHAQMAPKQAPEEVSEQAPQSEPDATDSAADASDSSNALPKEMIGYWGLPDCGSPMDMVIYKPHYILSLTEEESCLQFVEMVKKGPDYNLVVTDFETFMSRRTNDGLLEEVYPDDENLREATQTWAELATGQRFEYAYCEEPSNNWYILHGPGLVGIEHIEDVTDACIGGVDDDCRQAMFDVADDNDDGVLQGFELGYASQIVAYFDSISHEGGNATRDLRPVMNEAKERGPRFSAAMLAAADTDESGDLTMEEVVAFWQDPHEAEVIAQVNATLAGLSDIFPFIRPIGPAGQN